MRACLCVRVRVRMRVNENVREKECYDEMNVNRIGLGDMTKISYPDIGHSYPDNDIYHDIAHFL